ncbi:Sulfate anion transporter 1 [Armadillidium vulgare]|nr:Sulfate anion transporter 1 [Armadillidium vulgare]
MKLFKIVGPIHFANRENLRRFIVKGTGLDPKELQKETDKQTEFEFAKEKLMHAIKNGSYFPGPSIYRILIIDCSGVSYIDSAGGKFLEQLWGDYDKANISLCLAGLPENVYEIMSKSGSLKTFPSEHLFHSIHDAVIILKQAKDPFKTKL